MYNIKNSFDFDSFASFVRFKENHTNTYEFDRLLFTVSDSSTLDCKIYKNIFSFSLIRDRLSKDTNKPVIIICSKDLDQVLKFSLSKLKDFSYLDNYDIVLVDDRSSTDNIVNISDEFETSCIRIDNTLDIFNYSIINNIAAAYALSLNKKLLIFYNNDVWPSNHTVLDSLVDKHHLYKSDITGCKLLYPSKNDYENIGKPPHLLQDYLDKIYSTIQHGGIEFILRHSSFMDNSRTYAGPKITFAPTHSWRFYRQDTTMSSYDTRCFAVTGALHIINSSSFVELGGLNPSLGTTFQDIDLCIRAIESNRSVYYIGSEHLFHAESITNSRDNITQSPDFISDNILWDLSWGKKLPNLLGFQVSIN